MPYRPPSLKRRPCEAHRENHHRDAAPHPGSAPNRRVFAMRGKWAVLAGWYALVPSLRLTLSRVCPPERGVPAAPRPCAGAVRHIDARRMRPGGDLVGTGAGRALFA
jgi:hypothetical protein